MTDLRQLCLDLDEIVIQFFQTLEETMRKQTELESLMKDGFINMAKARYNMGQHSVGALQYHEEDLEESLAHLTVIETDEGTAFAERKFELASDNNDDKANDESGLRKRNVKDEVSSSVEDISDDVSGNQSKEETDSEKKPNLSKDPIKWFGVLVPQSLRQSQMRFKACVPLCCELATLQSRLLSLKAKYRQLHKEKDEILGDVSDCDPTRPMSLSMSSVSSISSAEDLTEELKTTTSFTEE